MSDTIAGKLAELGYKLPTPNTPAGNYVAATRSGNLLLLAGQISQIDGKPAYLGRLGGVVSLEHGRKAAEAAALALLAQLAAATDGRLASVKRILRLGVYVASTPDFTQHSQVGHGASDLVAAVFGEAGKHARTSIGVASLPQGVSVEVDAIVELAE